MEENKDVNGQSVALPVKTKLTVFFTYYKWYLLIALFFVVFLTVMGVQMCTRDDYDISVMYAGNAILGDTDSIAIEGALEGLGADGEKAVLYELVIMNDEQLSQAYESGYTSASVNPEKLRKNREMLAFHIMADEYFILLLSPECYEIMASNNALERLDDIGASGGTAVRHSEYAFKLNTLEFAKQNSAFSALPADTLICFKKISEMNAEKTAKLEKREHDIAYFIKLTIS